MNSHKNKSLEELVIQLNGLSYQPFPTLKHLQNYTFDFYKLDQSLPLEKQLGIVRLKEALCDLIKSKENKKKENNNGDGEKDKSVTVTETGETFIRLDKEDDDQVKQKKLEEEAQNQRIKKMVNELFDNGIPHEYLTQHLTKKERRMIRNILAHHLNLRTELPPSTIWVKSDQQTFVLYKGHWLNAKEYKIDVGKNDVVKYEYTSEIWFGDKDPRNRIWKSRINCTTKHKALLDASLFAIQLGKRGIENDKYFGEAIRLVVDANDLFINKYILFNTSQSVSSQSEDTKDRKLYNYLKDLYREFGLRAQFVISDVRIETRGFNLEEEIQKVQNKIQEKEEKKREYGKKRERIKSLSKTIVETFNK